MLQDLPPALRSLLRTPATTLTAVGTLSLAFAANVAMFSVVDGVLFHELPFQQPDELLRIQNHPEDDPKTTFEISYPEFQEVKQGLSSLEGVAGYASMVPRLDVRVGTSLQSLPGYAVSGNLFSLLGTKPIAGRPWRESDDRSGAEPVVAISERLWRRLFGGDPGVLDSILEIGSQKHRLTTILPASFEYPPGAEIWIPVSSTVPDALLENPGVRFFNSGGALAPGKRRGCCCRRVEERVDETTDRELAPSARSRVSALPLSEDLLGSSRPTLFFLWVPPPSSFSSPPPTSPI